MLGSKRPPKEDTPGPGMKVVSLREGIKKLVSEIQEESFASMKKETLETIRQAMEAHRNEVEERLETHFEEFDERNILEDIREIKENLGTLPKAGRDVVTDDEFRANLLKSVDEAVRDKLAELEHAKEGMETAQIQHPKQDMKEISDMILKQFEAFRQSNQQDFNTLRAQMLSLRQKLAQFEELEDRIHELEDIIQRKLAEPIIIE